MFVRGENQHANKAAAHVFTFSQHRKKKKNRSREAQRLSNEWASRGGSKSYSSVTDDVAGADENGLIPSGGAGPKAYVEGGEEEPAGELARIWIMITDKWINVMMVFVPAGFIVTWLGCSDTTIFVVNFLAMVVSELLCRALR